MFIQGGANDGVRAPTVSRNYHIHTKGVKNVARQSMAGPTVSVMRYF